MLTTFSDMDTFIVLLAREVRGGFGDKIRKRDDDDARRAAVRIRIAAKSEPWDVRIDIAPSPLLTVLEHPGKSREIESAAANGTLKLSVPPEQSSLHDEDCTVTFDSAETLQRLATNDLGIGAAFLSGRVKLKGDRNALRSLVIPLKAAGKAFASTFEKATSNVRFVQRGSKQWVPDDLRRACARCSAAFSFSARRHHCRVCGEIVCDACSRHRIKSKRSCTKCYKEVLFGRQKSKSAARIVKERAGRPIAAKSSSLTSYTESLLRKIAKLEKEVSTSSFEWMVSLTFSLFAFVVYAAFGTLAAFVFPNAMIGVRLPLYFLAVGLFFISTASMRFAFAFAFGFALGAFNIGVASMHFFHIGEALCAHPFVSCAAVAIFATIAALKYYFGRLVRIYSVAFRVIIVYWIASKILTRFETSTQDLFYGYLDRILAPYVCRTIMQLRSVFVKFGQYLGGRSDAVSKEWNRVLATLQDDMPFDRTRYVRDLVNSSLGKDCFESFDEVPIASASIAQVHKAVLKSGERVAVKIQHEGIVPIMNSDMKAYKQIVGFVAYLNSKFESIKVVLESWEKEMVKELDFKNEGSNLLTVLENFKDSSLRVKVPRPVKEHVHSNIMVMSFEDGFKITDKDKLNLYGIDKTALMERIVHIYGVQLLQKGVFNADPHAGNIYVGIDPEKGEAIPILFDFGMVVTLKQNERIGYCKLVNALLEFDVQGVADAIRKIGYQNSQSDQHPERDLEFFQFILRDTGSRQSQRNDMEKFKQQRKAQRKRDKEDSGGRKVEGRYFKDFPESLIFFFRVIGLIRGLCATLEVHVSYIEILGLYAKVEIEKKSDIHDDD